jgi:hypothetical protein
LESSMLRYFVVLAVLTLAVPVQAIQVSPGSNPTGIVVPVREACGAGMHRINGVCVRNVKACPIGTHLDGGRCVKT